MESISLKMKTRFLENGRKWKWNPGYRGLEPSGRHFPFFVTASHFIPFYSIFFYFILFYSIFIPVRAPSGRPASHPQPAGQPVIFHFCCPAGLTYPRKPLIYTYILRKSRFLCLETRRRQPFSIFSGTRSFLLILFHLLYFNLFFYFNLFSFYFWIPRRTRRPPGIYPGSRDLPFSNFSDTRSSLFILFHFS